MGIYKVFSSWYHRLLTKISLEVLYSYNWWPLAHVVELVENTMLMEKMWFQMGLFFSVSQPTAILGYYMNLQFLNICPRPIKVNPYNGYMHEILIQIPQNSKVIEILLYLHQSFTLCLWHMIMLLTVMKSMWPISLVPQFLYKMLFTCDSFMLILHLQA